MKTKVIEKKDIRKLLKEDYKVITFMKEVCPRVLSLSGETKNLQSFTPMSTENLNMIMNYLVASDFKLVRKTSVVTILSGADSRVVIATNANEVESIVVTNYRTNRVRNAG